VLEKASEICVRFRLASIFAAAYWWTPCPGRVTRKRVWTELFSPSGPALF
jgi:hypothetical protein